MQLADRIIRVRVSRRRTRILGAGLAALCLAASGAVTGAAASAATTGSAVPPSCPPPAPGQVTCFAIFHAPAVPAGRAAAAAAAGAVAGYGPTELAAAYQIPPSDTTAAVAVVTAYNDPDVASNLAAYRRQFGLPDCATDCLQVVDQYGQANLPTEQAADWIGETDLDVQMIAAVCPTCHITVVEANSQSARDMYQAVRTASTLSHYVVMSWGSPEWGRVAANNRRNFGARDVAYVAASGDYGWGRAYYPASSPSVLAVGGTRLERSTTDPRGWTETVWNSDDGRATGAGCSGYFPQASWQAPSAADVCTERAVADISLVADPADGVAVLTDPAPGTDSGPTWTIAGGTSVGAPIAAAMYAIAGQPSGYAHPSAYPYYNQYYNPAALTDVVSGNDLFLEPGCDPSAQCTARAGYDAPSGLGTPAGIAAFAPVPSVPVSVDPHTDVTDYLGTAAAVRVNASTSDPLARITYSAPTLPPGMQLNRRTGRITGTPTQPGTYSVTVRATSSGGTRAKTSFLWQVRQHRLVPGRVPHLVGAESLGSTLHVRFGRWHQDRAHGAVVQPQLAFRWFADGHRIRNAHSAAFIIPRRHRWLHRHLEARVTARLPDYLPYAQTTPRSDAIRRAA
ncbi:MAG TPA: putative Ig domain-containing protein [Jatrophihabitans sp.]|nr:putative Ig domain-containing protein [Jatrophihabitans sp.]